MLLPPWQCWESRSGATGTRCSTEKMVIFTTLLSGRGDLILFLGTIWIAPQEMRVTCLCKFRMNLYISCLGNEICESVVKQIEKSKFYSVMADETTDESTKTQLSICVRYLTDNFEVEEAFLGFVDLHKTDAETISEVLIDNV